MVLTLCLTLEARAKRTQLQFTWILFKIKCKRINRPHHRSQWSRNLKRLASIVDCLKSLWKCKNSLDLNRVELLIELRPIYKNKKKLTRFLVTIIITWKFNLRGLDPPKSLILSKENRDLIREITPSSIQRAHQFSRTQRMRICRKKVLKCRCKRCFLQPIYSNWHSKLQRLQVKHIETWKSHFEEI